MLENKSRKSLVITASMINKKIQNEIFDGRKLPHITSYPVIHLKDNQYYLAVFITLYTKEEIESGYLGRPTKWAIFDIETGKIRRYKHAVKDVIETSEEEFSSAPYNIKYNIRSDKKYDNSEEYYEEAFKILDKCRESIMDGAKINLGEYQKYLEKILNNVPESYRRFYLDLSI